MKPYFLISILFLLCIQTIQAQYTTFIKTIDEKGNSIEFVQIRHGGLRKGAYTNHLGIAKIQVDKFPDTVQFTKLGIENKVLIINAYKKDTLQVVLQNIVFELPEVDFKYDYLRELLINAARLLRRQKINFSYAKCLSRSITFSNKEPSEFNEFIFDAELTSSGVWRKEFENGRYALKKGFIEKHNRVSGYIPMYNPWWIDPNDVFNDSLGNKFEVKLLGYTHANYQKLAIIQFKAKTNQTLGEIWIEQNSYQIYKYNINIPIKQKDTFYSMQGDANYEIAFAQINDTAVAPQYSRLKFDLFIKASFLPIKVHNITNAQDYYYSHSFILPSSFAKPRTKLQIGDYQKLIDKKTYDGNFWKSIPVVELTPSEKEVYKTLRSAKRKGNLFE